MTGFKNFILRGNLVELAVALIMALAFAAVIKATVDLLMGIIGKAGGHPELQHPAAGRTADRGVDHGCHRFPDHGRRCIYYVIVVPYTKAKERYFPAEETGTPADVALLTEIRDLLAASSCPVLEEPTYRSLLLAEGFRPFRRLRPAGDAQGRRRWPPGVIARCRSVARRKGWASPCGRTRLSRSSALPASVLRKPWWWATPRSAVSPLAGAADSEVWQTFALPLCAHHAHLLRLENQLVEFDNGTLNRDQV